MDEQDDELFQLAEEPPEPRDRRWGRWVLFGLGALLVVAVVGLTVSLVRGGSPGQAAAAATPTATRTTATATATATTATVVASTAPASPSRPAPSSPASPTAYRLLSAAQLDQARRDLSATVATLPHGVSLRSPAAWDAYGPAGKTYPGASAADDMSTCPHLADRLSAELGTRMSYWVGTLPGGGGCTWATVPLSYDGPYTYPYTLNVDFLPNGGAEPSTTEHWRAHFYEDQGAICPDADAPAVGAGAVLVACTAEPGDPSYLLLLPDARGAGLWILSADARSTAAHPAPSVLRTLVRAADAAY